MANVKAVFICQSIDVNRPVNTTAIEWARRLYNHPDIEDVTIITLKAGNHYLPKSIEIFSIKSDNFVKTLIRFYQAVLHCTRTKKADFFFIYQGGYYPILLQPFKFIFRKPIYQWKAHRYIDMQMRFMARFCDTLIFTSTQNAFPMRLDKIRVIGQSVDTEKFVIQSKEKTGDLVVICRITRSKNIHRIIHILYLCNKNFGVHYRLDLYGACKDVTYKKEIEMLIQQQGLSDFVTFHGEILHRDVPDVLNHYRLYINFTHITALDRSVVEAMACGLPVISTNPCVADILPDHLKTVLIAPYGNDKAISEKIHSLLTMNMETIQEMRHSLRELVVRHHNLNTTWDRILQCISMEN